MKATSGTFLRKVANPLCMDLVSSYLSIDDRIGLAQTHGDIVELVMHSPSWRMKRFTGSDTVMDACAEDPFFEKLQVVVVDETHPALLYSQLRSLCARVPNAQRLRVVTNFGYYRQVPFPVPLESLHLSVVDALQVALPTLPRLKRLQLEFKGRCKNLYGPLSAYFKLPMQSLRSLIMPQIRYIYHVGPSPLLEVLETKNAPVMFMPLAHTFGRVEYSHWQGNLNLVPTLLPSLRTLMLVIARTLPTSEWDRLIWTMPATVTTLWIFQYPFKPVHTLYKSFKRHPRVITSAYTHHTLTTKAWKVVLRPSASPSSAVVNT